MPTYDDCVNLITDNLADLSDILPEEHREVEKAILDYCKDRMDNIELTTPTQLEVIANIKILLADHEDEFPTGSGLNFNSVELLAGLVNDARYKINYATPIQGNYFVVLTVESMGTSSQSWDNDNDIILTYKNPTSSSIEVLLREVAPNGQSLSIHLTIVKY